MDHCGWCHPGGWGSRVMSPSKLVSGFSRSLWISSILQVPALSPTLDSLGGGLSLGSSRWNKTFPSQAALSYCLFRSTEKLTMTVSHHVIPMYFFLWYFGKVEGSLSGFILYTPRYWSRVPVHFPSSLFREPSPHLHPCCPTNREIGHELLRAEQSSVFSYMKYNFGMAVSDMFFICCLSFCLCVPRTDPS